jgi:hypothetical protein
VLGCHIAVAGLPSRLRTAWGDLGWFGVMSCEEKGRLLRQYDDATLAFSNAVQEQRRKIGTAPIRRFSEQWISTVKRTHWS